MTPQGAVISRMASASRAGEERYAAADLADLGVPIMHTVYGDGTFEGADVVVANEDLVFVGHGMRSNRSGAEQVADAFRRVGVPEVIIVEIPYGCGHIDGTINVIDKDLSLVFPTQLSWVVYDTMRRHGFRFVDLPSGEEAQMGMAINMVPLAPRVVVLPAGNPITVRTLQENGCECLRSRNQRAHEGRRRRPLHDRRHPPRPGISEGGWDGAGVAPLHVLHLELERGDDAGSSRTGPS